MIDLFANIIPDINHSISRNFQFDYILCGLAVLFLSDFVPTRRFAELGSVTMAGALIGDLFLLPACLILYHRFRNRKGGNVGRHANSRCDV